MIDLIWHHLDLAIVGLIAALFGNFLSRRQQVSQLWWEKKADAYIRILTALSEVTEYHEAEYENITHEAEHSREWLEKLGTRWEAAEREIKTAERTGQFLISAEAHAALERRRKTRAAEMQGKDPDDPEAYVGAEYVAAANCLKELLIAARLDLRRVLGWRSIWSSQL